MTNGNIATLGRRLAKLENSQWGARANLGTIVRRGLSSVRTRTRIKSPRKWRCVGKSRPLKAFLRVTFALLSGGELSALVSLNHEPQSITDLAWQAEAFLLAYLELFDESGDYGGHLIRKLFQNIRTLGALPQPDDPRSALTIPTAEYEGA